MDASASTSCARPSGPSQDEMWPFLAHVRRLRSQIGSDSVCNEPAMRLRAFVLTGWWADPLTAGERHWERGSATAARSS
jgi:hypothetical protein